MIITWTDADGNSQTFRNTSVETYRLVMMDGLGPPPGNIIQQRAVLQHGTTVVETFLQPRTITIQIMVRATTQAQYELNRKYISDLFSPITMLGYPNVGTLSFLMADDVTQYEIAAIPQEVNHESDRPAQNVVNSTITLLAPDPYFTAPEENDEEIGSVGSLGYYVDVISNSGDAPVYPTLIVIGPSADPKFTNLETERAIQWEGSVPSGSRLEIDCELKTVTLIVIATDVETDAFDGLAIPPNDDFWTLIPGVNTLLFESSDSNGSPLIEWLEKFRSIY